MLLLYKYLYIIFCKIEAWSVIDTKLYWCWKINKYKMISKLEMIYTLYINNDVYSSNELVSIADHRLLGSAVRHCFSAVSRRCVQQFGFRFRYDGFHGKWLHTVEIARGEHHDLRTSKEQHWYQAFRFRTV